MSKKYTIEDMKALAHAKGGKCLSTEYINFRMPLLWECAKGHRWKETPSRMLQGAWCPVDMGIRIYTIDDLKDFAEKHGGKCLSDAYKGPNAKYLWVCEKGHQWLASWSAIMHGYWCPTEGREGRKQDFITQVRDIEEKTGIRCLSDTFPNAITPLIWECRCGHIWKASINTIRNGRLCPYDVCKNVKEEQKLTEEDLTFLRNKYPNMGERTIEFLEYHKKKVFKEKGN